jgi:transcriptional regulator with XRE-family HTH domain
MPAAPDRGERERLDMDMEDKVDAPPAGYARKVGERLRAIRRQKGLSLQDVESGSQLEFKASVLGAYERGERAISVPRLQRLARFYRVPVDQLLPRDDGDGFPNANGVLDLREGKPAAAPQPVTIDLTRLREVSGAAGDLLRRYLHGIQVQRQDFNGRMLTIRRDDLRAIACILDTNLDGVADRLDDLGLCFAAP